MNYRVIDKATGREVRIGEPVRMKGGLHGVLVGVQPPLARWGSPLVLARFPGLGERDMMPEYMNLKVEEVS